jgi:SAM-dependent methyltransferase
MQATSARIRDDFDRIALLPRTPGDHNARYHHGLLKQLPPSLGSALDLGCGTGEFSRLLATRAERVLGLDLSPNMVRVARERSAHLPNVEFQVADIACWEFPGASFDCVATIATLHHLEMEKVLIQARSSLRPGGTLLVLDLYDNTDAGGMLASAVALPIDRLGRLLRTGRMRPPAEVRRAWAEHGRLDRYPRVGQVRKICRELLPGARVRRHLFWRYSIVWRKASATVGPL